MLKNIWITVAFLLITLTCEAAPTLHFYKGHGIYAPFYGLENAVIVENVSGVPTVRMWWHAEDWGNNTTGAVDINYGPGGVKSIDGTQTSNGSKYGQGSGYPFVNNRIMYMDCPVSSFVAAVQGNTTIPWANKGTVWGPTSDGLNGFAGTKVAKDRYGNYHMLIRDFSTAGGLLHLTSSTGMPGSWTSQGYVLDVGLVPGGGYTSSFWFNSDNSVDVLTDTAQSNVSTTYLGWNISYLHGVESSPGANDALNHLTLVADKVASPSSDPGGPDAISVNGQWAVFGHGPTFWPGSPSTTSDLYTPTDLNLNIAPSLSGPYTPKAHTITLAMLNNVFAYGDSSIPLSGSVFNSRTTSATSIPANATQSVGTAKDSQLGNQVLVEINGYTYVFYCTVWREAQDIPSLSVAYWDDTLSNVIKSYAPELYPSATTAKATIRGSFR